MDDVTAQSQRKRDVSYWLHSDLRYLFVVCAEAAFIIAPGLAFLIRDGPILPSLPWYPVTIEGFTFVAAGSAAFLAWARYSEYGEWTDLSLACALVTYAIVDIFYILSFPGLTADGSVLARNPNTVAIIYLIKYIGFATILWTAFLSTGSAFSKRTRSFPFMAALISGSALVASGYSIFRENNLPHAMIDGQYTPFAVWASRGLYVLLVGAGLVAWRRHLRSGDRVLGHTASAVLLIACQSMLAGFFGIGRYDAGWYSGRFLQVAGFALLLYGYLAEYPRLQKAERRLRDFEARRTEIFYGVSRAMASSLEPGVALGRLVEGAVSTVSDGATVLLLRDGVLVTEVTIHRRGDSRAAWLESMRALCVPVGAGVAGKVVADGKAAVISDLGVASSLSPLLGDTTDAGPGTRSLIDVPIRTREGVIGVLALSRTETADSFDEADLAFAQGLADAASAALESARLYSDLSATRTQLQELLSRWERLAESMSEAFYAVDAKGNLIKMNQSALRLCRFESEKSFLEAIRTQPDILEVLHPDGRWVSAVEWLTNRALKGETFTSQELSFRRKDIGDLGIWSVTEGPVRDAEGVVIGMVATAHDISTQKRAEAERDGLFAELEATLASIPAGVLVFDRAGRVIRSNATAQEMLGHSPYLERLSIEERVNLLRVETHEGSEIPSDRLPVAQALRGEVVADVILSVQPEEGPRIWMSASAAPMRSADGDVLGAVLAFSNITRLRELREQQSKLLTDIQAQKSELEATINGVADAIVVYDSGGKILRMNPAAKRMFGYTEEQVKMSPSERQRLLEAKSASEGRLLPTEKQPLARALRGETVTGVIGSIRREKGRRRWISTSAAPIHGAGGEILGAVGVTTDVTEIHDLQERERDLLRTVSHDLKTPLTAIQGYADLLVRALEKTGQHSHLSERARVISDSSRRMTAMINQISESARLESGQMRVSKLELDPRTFVADLVARLYVPHASGRIRLEISDGLPPVMADPTLLERVFTNLLNNALKYSPEGSQVVLKVDAADREVVVAVIDQGRGIPEEDLLDLFDRFHRAKNAGSQEGLGLGLYITRLLVEMQAGRIWVESDVNRGSKFFFTIPVSRQ